jgi:hypothetical protein
MLVEYVRGVLAAMATSPHFPAPTPPLATVATSVSALEAAQAVTRTRALDSIALRDAARAQLLDLMRILFGHVQQVADASPEQAEAIIASAGLRSHSIGVRHKPPFVVKAGTVTGSAHLVAKAASKRAAYVWQYSLDGGKTWTPATTTKQASTIFTGLPVATRVSFRFYAVTRSGAGDWSQPVALVIR